MRRSFPRPTLPDLSLLPQLVIGALSLALIGLIQGAEVSKTIPNSNGRYGDVSQDFAAQGISNIVAGLFKGIPVGSSVSGTAVSDCSIVDAGGSPALDVFECV